MVISEGCATQGDASDGSTGGKEPDLKQEHPETVVFHSSGGCCSSAPTAEYNHNQMSSFAGKEIDLAPGSPLVLTHKIKLVPSDSASGSGSCGCDADFAPLRERLERLEREVSALRETCGGAEGNCCSSNESKGKTGYFY